jgi:hypothetical protein
MLTVQGAEAYTHLTFGAATRRRGFSFDNMSGPVRSKTGKKNLLLFEN